MAVNIRKYHWLLLLLCLAALGGGCKASRYLRPDELLLRKPLQFEGNDYLKTGSLESAVKTRSNRRMLWARTYLHLWNAGMTAYRDTTGFINRNLYKTQGYRNLHRGMALWLINTVGEPPAILDEESIKRDSANLRNLYFANGFFYPTLSYEIDTVDNWLNKQKADVTFYVREGTAYKVRRVLFEFPPGAEPDVDSAYNTRACLIVPGDNYSHSAMTAERVRATKALKDHGYFSFSQSMIDFRIDTFVSTNVYTASRDSARYRWADVTVLVKEMPPQLIIDDVLVRIKSSSESRGASKTFVTRLESEAMTDERRKGLNLPERRYEDNLPVDFVVSSKVLSRLNYNFLAKRIYLREGELYSETNKKKTQRRLQELGMFQLVLVRPYTDSTGMLRVLVELQLSPQYQIRSGFELFTSGFTSVNLPSVGLNVRFRNKNAFKKSEFFEFSVFGNVGFYNSLEGLNQLFLYYEVGASASLNFPDIALPWVRRDFSSLSPLTTLSANYRLESRREFNRSAYGVSLSYRWNARPFDDRRFSRFAPINIDIISISDISPDFANQIAQLPLALQLDYERRFSSRMQYAFTISDYGNTRTRPTSFLRPLGEIGGNLPWLLDLGTRGASENQDINDNFVFDSLRYAQYVKVALEGKRFVPLSTRSELVMRAFAGFSVAYNSQLPVPKESRFFSGGTNSLRGWRTNTLGPGRTSLDDFSGGDTLTNNLISPGGEIIFEVNLEYRFDVTNIFEVAIFTDAGNVWFNPLNTNQSEVRDERAFISIPNLVLGWDAGVGLRMDFNFLVLRVDVAQQIYAPDLTRESLGDGWVFRRFNELGGNRFQLNIGIGYPF